MKVKLAEPVVDLATEIGEILGVAWDEGAQFNPNKFIYPLMACSRAQIEEFYEKDKLPFLARPRYYAVSGPCQLTLYPCPDADGDLIVQVFPPRVIL